MSLVASSHLTLSLDIYRCIFDFLDAADVLALSCVSQALRECSPYYLLRDPVVLDGFSQLASFCLFMGLGNQSYLGRFMFLQHLRLQRTIELPAQSPSTEGRLLCFLFKNASALKTLWFAVQPVSVEVHPSVAMSLANANLLEVLTVEFHHRYQIDTLLSSIPTGRLITLHLKDRNLMPTAEEELDLITVLASQQPTETLETLHLSCRFTLPAISSNPIRYPQVTKLSLERRSNDSDDWTTGQLMQLFPNVQRLSFTWHTTASLPSAAQTEQRTRNLASQASSSSRWERLDILVGSIGGLHSLGLQCTVQKAIMSFCGVADALLVLATLASLQPAKLTLIFNPRLSGDLTLHDCVVIVPFFFVNVSRKTNSLHIELHIKDNVSGLHELLVSTNRE